MDLSQSDKLQRSRTTYYSERYRLLCVQETVDSVISQQFVFSTLTILADLCVMASVLLHGLPLLLPSRVWFKSVGYLPESHPAVI